MLLKTNQKHFFLIQAILVSIYFPILFGAGGFLIQPSAAAADCGSCARSGGRCVYDRSSDSTVCYKQSHVRILAGAAAPAPLPSLGAKFTLVNNCSETIWPAIRSSVGSPNLESTGFELPIGTSRAVDAPTRWTGRFWGRTNCTFNDSGNATCSTDYAVATLAEFGVGLGSADFYDVSLVNGFNLPLRVDPVGGSGQCNSTGCVVDINRLCPEELRTDGGGACRSACNAFNTTVHCCSGTTCRPTLYSQLFKNSCPLAYSYATDDATSTFTCPSTADYVITFCASSIPGQNISVDDGPAIGLGPSPEPSFPRTSDPGTSSSPIGTIAGVILGVLTILSIMLYCYIKRRRESEGPYQLSNQVIEKFLLQHGSLALKRYKYSEIKKITKSLNEKLGQGGYGSVYKGVLPDGSLVAVKVLIEADSNGEEFINEVASISRTSHVNIVNLLGFCFDRNKRALVYQFMANKSLDKFISNKDSCPIDLQTMYGIAVGVAKGLEYLHTGCNTRIVHFDIKPQNILLDEDFCPKISDFGLAKLGKKKQSVISMLGTRGTIGYIAPEVFSRNFGGVSYKSDVYSYGMMVLEMAGARKFVENEAIQSSENYFPDKIYEEVVLDVTKRLGDFTFEEELEETTTKMFLVGFWCIQTNPSDRPTMSKVLEMLEGSLQSIQIPPKPVLCTPILPAQDGSSSFSTYVETENSSNVVTI
ncbi:hypothetical protein ACP275_12G030700 [Erythranthe tilingii]